MEQNIAAANDGQVAAPETKDNTEVDIAPQEAGGAGEEATQAFSQDEVQKQEADGNATRAFSQRLKREKEKYDKEYEPYKELFEELRALGVEAESPREALLFLRAESEAYAQRQSHAEKVSAEEMFYAALEAEPAYLAAKEMAYEKMYADDLAAIKEVFPDVTASHVSQLGQVYLSLMRAGLGDVVAAYAAARAIEERMAKAPPASMGSVANAAGEDKEYYSPADVDRLPKKAYNNAGIMAKIKKSMTKW